MDHPIHLNINNSGCSFGLLGEEELNNMDLQVVRRSGPSLLLAACPADGHGGFPM